MYSSTLSTGDTSHVLKQTRFPAILHIASQISLSFDSTRKNKVEYTRTLLPASRSIYLALSLLFRCYVCFFLFVGQRFVLRERNRVVLQAEALPRAIPRQIRRPQRRAAFKLQASHPPGAHYPIVACVSLRDIAAVSKETYVDAWYMLTFLVSLWD